MIENWMKEQIRIIIELCKLGTFGIFENKSQMSFLI